VRSAVSATGEAGAVAGSAVWLSFLMPRSFLLSSVTPSSRRALPRLGRHHCLPDAGFGNERLAGIASWLGYAAAFVIGCSMVAVSFGSYAASLVVVGDRRAAGQLRLRAT
jgi:hypothetical protein